LNSAGCIQRDTIIINVVQDINLPTNFTTCLGQPIAIGRTAALPPGYRINWLVDSNFINQSTPINPIVQWNTLPAGGFFIYRYIITGPNNCVFSTKAIRLNLINQAGITPSPDDTVCNGQTLTFGTSLQTGYTFVWRSSEGEVVNTPSITRVYINSNPDYRQVTWYLTAITK
jgi:hypothetical protein